MTILQHGAYSTETIFDIKKHEYAAASHTDYIELLEVTNAPKGKEPFVVNHYNVHDGHQFCEVGSLSLAKKAFLVVANGFVSDIRGHWKEKLKIEKMYFTKSPIVEPWFYANQKQLFGKDKEFSVMKKLVKNHRKLSSGTEFLVFSKRSAFSIETVAGTVADGTVIWESGKSSSIHELRKIEAYDNRWEDQKAVGKWRTFLSNGEATLIELEFPIWNVRLHLVMAHGTIQLNLTVEEEFKDEVAGQTYWKDRKEIPRELIFTNQHSSVGASMVDVVKFFISE